MEYVTLVNTDLKVSRLGFGCYQIPLIPKEQTSYLVNFAIDKGINFFEVARDYRDSEERLGRIFRGNRDKIVLATKMGARKPLDIRKILDVSLRKLKTDYLDIYTMEGVNTISKLEDYKETIIPELDRLKKDGTIRYIGMSTHDFSVIEEAEEQGLEIDVYFTPANIMLRRPMKSKIPFVAIKAFGGYKYYYMQGQDVKYIQDLSEFDEWFEPELALNYLFSFNNIQSILCGFTSTEQITKDCEVERERMLTVANLEQIKSLFFNFLEFNEKYCDDCGKCQCPNGIRIPFLMRLWKYYDFYDIINWTSAVYNMLDADYRDCDGCKQCELICPKRLKIRSVLRELDECLRNEV